MILEALLFFLIGLLLLWKGADWLINGTTHLGTIFRIPEVVLGLTVLAFGTSAPELFVNAFAVIGNKPDIIWGNILGSNIANILLILGISGLFAAIPFKDTIIKRDLPFSVAVLAILVVLLKATPSPVLHVLDGIVLLVAFISYLFLMLRTQAPADQEPSLPIPPLWKAIFLFLIGLLSLPLGAKLLIGATVTLSTALGISEAVIALVAVAIGTSLPELVTSLVAVRKKKADLAVGNVIGSNIFNIVFVLGICSTLGNIPFNPTFYHDIMGIVAISVLTYLFVRFSKTNEIQRWQAGVLLLLYISYIVSLGFRGI